VAPLPLPRSLRVSVTILAVTVELARDWVDWLLFSVQLLSVIGTLAAALFAYVAIRHAKAQAADAQAALVRERRLDFELGVLKDLLQTVVRADPEGALALVTMLPIEDVPLTAAVLGVPSTPEAEQRRRNLYSYDDKSTRLGQAEVELVQELQLAVVARVQSRLSVWGP